MKRSRTAGLTAAVVAGMPSDLGIEIAQKQHALPPGGRYTM
ncbi:hypothetical protein [Streptomyces sp.]|nr:hypothetical protein [Streptomyces sp.]